MKWHKAALAAAIISTPILVKSADDIESLKKQIQELDQKVKALERNRELETQKAKDNNAPRLIAGANGFGISSADTNFSIALHGVLQVDNRTFFNDSGIQGNDGFLIRRARPIVQGTVFHDFDFLFVPDFGSGSAQQIANPTPVIQDAYLNYRYQPWLQLRAGKFKSPVSLEQLQSDPVTFFNERALPTALAPNRDIGFQVWGDIAGGVVSYAAGVFNGVGDGRSTGTADFEDHREFAGRLFFQPFKTTSLEALRGFGIGVGGTYGNVRSSVNGLPATTGGTLAGYFTDGQQQFFAYNAASVGTNTPIALADGSHWRLAPQGYYYYGPFGLLGEYIISNQRLSRTVVGPTSDRLEQTAWQVTGSWILTGEDASYYGVTPKSPFDPRNGNWGALQVVGRYAELDIDDDAFPLFANPASSASRAKAWSAGLNWYLNKNIRMNASYSRTTFEGGGSSTAATAPASVTRQPESVFFSRLQLAF